MNGILAAALAAVPALSLGGTAAGQPAGLSVEQAAIVYDQCLARAAVRASRTDAADEAIFGLARSECAATRSALTAGRVNDAELVAVLAAIDAAKEASFPELTRRVRERRRLYEAETRNPN